MKQEPSKFDYNSFGYAVVWFLGNGAIGLTPLLFLIIVDPILPADNLSGEITHLLKGGMILFVCCALMGDVIIEILIEKIHFRRFAFFALNLSPFILLGIICLLYLLVLLGHVRNDMFSSVSFFYVFVVSFTMVYCVSGKYFLYKSKRNHSSRNKPLSDGIS